MRQYEENDAFDKLNAHEIADAQIEKHAKQNADGQMLQKATGETGGTYKYHFISPTPAIKKSSQPDRSTPTPS